MPEQDASAHDAGAISAPKPFQFRGRLFTAVALRLESAAVDAGFYAALDAQLRQTPQFFLDAPVIVDLEQAGTLDPAVLPGLVAGLRARKLSAFGVQNATPAQQAAAAAAGLVVVPRANDGPLRPEAGPAPARRSSARRAEPAPPEAPAPAPGAQMILTPVRSGQTVVAEHGDLVVVGPVSSGAELIAAGNIHVYGRLRGRAMAGAFGDTAARIFCQSLDAELVAIAGYYRTSETLAAELQKRAVQIFLKDRKLCLEALG